MLHEITDTVVVKGFSNWFGIRSRKFVIRSNGSSYPFEKEMSFLQLLRLSVRTKLLSARKACGRAIRSKKIVI